MSSRLKSIPHVVRSREINGSYISSYPNGFIDQLYGSNTFVTSLVNSGDLVGHKGCVNVISFSKNGEFILTGSDDGDVRVWNSSTRECLRTLSGHVSNVFAADFLGYASGGALQFVSGGNDADVRVYDLERATTTVYRHHAKKVLKLSVNPVQPFTFLTCGADGSVRMFDTRKSYLDSETTELKALESSNRDEYVVAQAFGGGRPERFEGADRHLSSMIVDYATVGSSTNSQGRRRRNDTTIYSVDMHPTDGYTFIAASGLGDVRQFDMRMLRAFSANAYVNIYKNWEIPGENHPCTGCAFSANGEEIVATFLNEFIYLFDTRRNYEQEYNLTKEVAEKITARAVARNSRIRIPKVPEDQCSGLDADGVRVASIARYIVQNDFFGIRQARSSKRSSNADDDEAQSSSSSSSFESPAAKRVKDSEMNAMEVEQSHPLLSSGAQDSSFPSALARVQQESSRTNANGEYDEIDAILNEYIDEDDNSEEGEMNDDEEFPKQTFVRKFSGHVSSMTIKGCNFYGRRSEWIVSGSDDARVYLWNKFDGSLVNVLCGHEDVVNCVVAAPDFPILATSGIDNVVKLWEPVGRLTEKQEKKRLKLVETLLEEHASPYGPGERSVDVGSMCTQQ